jgi:EAL domain-containing protein (putative c-di-GMP-specific phosphodiesterase class I)
VETRRPSELGAILQARALRTVFQPIVSADGAAVVGYEALTRGPRGSALEAPADLFAAALREGRLAALDAACGEQALERAVELGCVAPLLLFVNIEPEVLDQDALRRLTQIARQAPRELRIVIEITERAIAARPAELLGVVERIRTEGWAVALDDVGADPTSLAFMSLLQPEVVKLDLSLIQRLPSPSIAAVMHAVNAYTEASGALLLAEGVETPEHLAAARGLGAELAQGWLHGRPADHLADLPIRPLELPARAAGATSSASPFACIAPDTPIRRARKQLLIELSKRLEEEAHAHGRTAIVTAAFQESRHLTHRTARRYARLAAATAFVCALGEGLPEEPAPGVRGARLDPSDPVVGEWDVVVLTPHFSAALLARDLGDAGPDLERRFDYALTYRRDACVAAARALLARVSPQSGRRAEPLRLSDAA